METLKNPHTVDKQNEHEDARPGDRMAQNDRIASRKADFFLFLSSSKKIIT